MGRPSRSPTASALSVDGVLAPSSPVSDPDLVAGVLEGPAWAKDELYRRYAPLVERTLRHILGHDRHTELVDVLHDAFVEALASIGNVRDAQALPAWFRTIAVHTAHKTITRRRARRWLLFFQPDEVPEVAGDTVDYEMKEAVRKTYEILDRLPTPERIAFALRHVDGLELTQVADACEVSLATIKRRLASAQRRFARAAEREEALEALLVEGGRWQ